MLKRLRDICFFLILIFIDLMGNEPFHYSINIESGLPSNEIYDITSDADNIIWITTDRGVVKYTVIIINTLLHRIA